MQIDYSKKWLAMLAVAMGVFLSTVDGSIVNVALPTLVRELNTQFAVVQWVVLAYLLTVTTLMLGVGRLADMIGKKPLYTAGFAVFTIGSVLCGLSPTVYWLIAARVLQAVGAAMVMALGTAIITESFPPAERGRALGMMGSVVSVGIVVGPTLGGLMLAVLSWHWIFFVNLPVGIIGIVMVIRFVPALKPSGGEAFDYKGAVTLFISLISLLIALSLGQTYGFTHITILALLGTWILFLAIFVYLELKTRHPMINLNLFRNELFSVNLITGFLTFVSMSGMLFLLPFFLENMLGYNTQQVGLLLAVVPILLGIVAPIAGSLSDRLGTRPITVAGLLCLVIGYYNLSRLNAQTTTLQYVVSMLPIGLGMGIFQSPNNSAVMGSVPRERLGIASGLLALTRTLGQTTGIAVLGALWAGQTAVIAGELPPGGATNAPLSAQVQALHGTFMVVLGLISLGLLLGIWGLFREKLLRAKPAQALLK